MRRTPTTAARRTLTTTDDVVAARAARTTGQAAAPAAADASVWGRLGESGAAGSATTRHAHTGIAGARDHSFRRQAGNNLYDHVAYTRRDYDLSFHEHRFCVDTDFTLRCTMGDPEETEPQQRACCTTGNFSAHPEPRLPGALTVHVDRRRVREANKNGTCAYLCDCCVPALTQRQWTLWPDGDPSAQARPETRRFCCCLDSHLLHVTRACHAVERTLRGTTTVRPLARRSRKEEAGLPKAGHPRRSPRNA